ncbi:TetR/AcrR family transcriptional regulator C-terminal domain-containing protein [Sphaerisporangium corydalis]|uniref:TetR/AcrR family transcriptional regulator C-terminal domain-containing protein n=1 Tax=Sphaerisporangium corydalis TaxID=1441875 RepID=A0ABV9EAG0_9ACTN|nr:TetR/AcrR family transcriptional regulator C-terminal domain-containing protein [Sphaerisporangium corydalis]
MTNPDPPYLRIVTEVRRRIQDGELAPGDRVPSTRQIAREWDVALATATKALTVLRQEGLVQARPRAGTTVAAPASPAAKPASTTAPASPSSAPGSVSGSAPARRRTGHDDGQGAPEPDRELTRGRVVRAAIEIADAEGLAALSMRGVAARLGVATMSPYRHVTSKDELVLLMADAAYAEEPYPPEVPSGWRERLELVARTLWVLHRRHPWLSHVTALTRPLPVPSLMVHGELALSALDGHGLAPAAVLDLHALMFSFVQGVAANLERAAQDEAATGMSEDQWMDVQGPALAAIAASGRYPTFARLVGELQDGYDLHLDDLFELGLRLLLDGLAPRMGDPPGQGRPAR